MLSLNVGAFCVLPVCHVHVLFSFHICIHEVSSLFHLSAHTQVDLLCWGTKWFLWTILKFLGILNRKMRLGWFTFYQRHFFSHAKCFSSAPYRALERITMNKSSTYASFWATATCLVWNSWTKHCKSSIWAGIGSIFLAVPPAGSGWTQNPREKST
jgi:hypothetical protein